MSKRSTAVLAAILATVILVAALGLMWVKSERQAREAKLVQADVEGAPQTAGKGNAAALPYLAPGPVGHLQMRQ
jgi:hypothetical protein